jgi:hypothetical protein
MSAMVDTAELLRRVLAQFLVVAGSLLGVLMVWLLLGRFAREFAWKRRQRLVARYRPVVQAITQAGVSGPVRQRLQQIPARHRRLVGDLLLAPLHIARGNIVTYVRDAAAAIGLLDAWLCDVGHREWWRRADALRALGIVEEQTALRVVLSALADRHEEVRAAAVDAAGRLRDARAIPALLEHLGDASRHQRARVVEALRGLGPTVTPALIEMGRSRADRAKVAADLLGLVGTSAAIEPLMYWCEDSHADVRAAALDALGSIGLDDRSSSVALRALDDTAPQARAMAARALGRGRRAEAASSLAARLDDEWIAAAAAAGALRQLGRVGVMALEARSGDAGQAGDLARQMLWSPPTVQTGA